MVHKEVGQLPQTFSKSTKSPLSGETLDEIFKFFGPFDEDAICYHRNHCLINCSLVSFEWRAVAMPLIWSRLKFDYRMSRDKVLEQLAFSATESRSHVHQRNHHGINYVQSIIVIPPAPMVKGDLLALAAPVARIVQLFSPNQLQEVIIYHTHTHLIPFSSFLATTLFPNLTCSVTNLVLHSTGHTFASADKLVLDNLPNSLETFKFSTINIYGIGAPSCFVRLLSLPNLRDLELDSIDTIDPAAFAQALRNWGSWLRRLSITSCHNLTRDAVVSALADACPNLTTFRLAVNTAFYQYVEEESLCRLVDACTGLRA
ncbi:hypothetical protein BC936DRAFT_138408 [Jimgerdemannia flammicorona]|uniref:F-box domain-containing protein n=1 Tax=Jimgerdemannia flammicorona TaxID=994334 RepID=A0A433DIK0_9FUNG|nr:hypothetical protein BC936DRAFT_138408 [Jimgerdemannia flammicorona]